MQAVVRAAAWIACCLRSPRQTSTRSQHFSCGLCFPKNTEFHLVQELVSPTTITQLEAFFSYEIWPCNASAFRAAFVSQRTRNFILFENSVPPQRPHNLRVSFGCSCSHLPEQTFQQKSPPMVRLTPITRKNSPQTDVSGSKQCRLHWLFAEVHSESGISGADFLSVNESDCTRFFSPRNLAS